MKISNFNKLGGTEFRKKFQIESWILFLAFVIENLEKLNNFKTEEREIFFVNWANEEEIYKYNEKNKIGRFKMLLSNLTKKIPILKEKDFKLNLRDEFKNLQTKKIKKELFFNVVSQKNKAFNKMLDFIYRNQEKKLKWKKIAHAFFVFDEKESFDKLYELNVVKEITNKIFEKNIKKFKQESKITDFIFRKPPSDAELINKIFAKKLNKMEITKEDIQVLDWKKFTHLKKIIRHSKKERIDIFTFLKRINDSKYDYGNFAKAIIKIQKEKLLNGDYLDLFNRWCNEFNIIPNRSRNNNRVNKILKENNLFIIQREKQITKYPFKKLEIEKFLKEINNQNFKFKLENKRLEQIPNSALAEYFVNLYFAYKFNLSIDEFKDSCNTIMSDDLFPIFTAPGRMSDMQILKSGEIINIETTILQTLPQFKKNEIFPSIEHMKMTIKNFHKHWKNQELKKAKLFMIWKHPKVKNITDSREELLDSFKYNLQKDLKNIIESNKIELKIQNFQEIINDNCGCE